MSASLRRSSRDRISIESRLKYLLDTNVAVDYFTGRYPSVAERLVSQPPDDVAISAIAVAELRFGADKSVRPAENHQRIDHLLEELSALDFETRAASAYGAVRFQLERAGTPIGPNDMLIAAQALAHSLIVVTDNTSEFSKVVGLSVENWRQ